MYGTVARIRLKDGAEREFDALQAEYAAPGGIPGLVSEHLFQSDTDPREYWMSVAFASKEAYWKNAESAEQHARYERLRALLDRDPEWHDGEIVFQFPSR